MMLGYSYGLGGSIYLFISRWIIYNFIFLLIFSM